MILLNLVQKFVILKVLYMSSISFKNLIIYTGYIFLFINLIIYFKSFRKNSKAFKYITYYLLFTSIIQLISEIIASNKTINNGNNLFLSHYYFIGQLILLSLFYYNIIKSKIKKLVILSLSSVIVLFLVITLISNNKLYLTFYLPEAVLCSLSIVIYSIFYFMESFGVVNKKFLIFNSGTFIYILTSTLIFSSANLIFDVSRELYLLVWNINSFLYIVFQILIFFEWYKNFRKVQLRNTP